MAGVYQSIAQIILAIETCETAGLHLPALMLIYSTIDAMGALTSFDEKCPVGDRFVGWCAAYLLPAVPDILCTPLELYAARCGILHTLTADSSLSAKGTRRVIYAWGSADVGKLHRASRQLDPEKWVGVHVSQLFLGLQLGITRMIEDAKSDTALAARLLTRGAKFFDSLPSDALDGI